jgi:hypothetical protein
VVVPRHLPHKKQLMSNLSPFTVDQFTHCTQDQDHGGPASPRIPSHTANASVDSSGSSSHWIDDVPITSPYKYHIQTFRVSRLPGGFMSGLSPNFITCVTRTDKALLNGPTSHGRNTWPTFFEPKVLCSCPWMSIMQCRMRNQCSGR